MKIEDYLANALADASADAHANSQIEAVAARALEQAESIAYIVARRLATLEAERNHQLPEKVKIEKERPAEVLPGQQ